MKNDLVFKCLAIAIVLVSTIEAKGGRGGGGGRSHSSWGSSKKSSSGSGWSFFGGGSKSGSNSASKTGSRSESSYSSIGSSNNFGVPHSGIQSSGGFFNGLVYSRPYHYNYRPIHITSGSSASNTEQQNSYGNYDEKYPYSTDTGYHAFDHTQLSTDVGNNLETKDDLKTDARNYAAGYAISKALNSDFFSIFNLVHDISKYPDKIRNKEFVPSTTPSTTTTSTTTSTTSTTTSTTTETPDTTLDTFTDISRNFYIQWPNYYDKTSRDYAFNHVDLSELLGIPKLDIESDKFKDLNEFLSTKYDK